MQVCVVVVVVVVVVINTLVEKFVLLSSAVTPFVLDTSPRTDVLLGTPGVVINCTIRGFPLSSVVWSKGGRPLNSNDSFVVTTLRVQDGAMYPLDSVSATKRFPNEGFEYFDAVSFLNITRGILREDTDNYTCTAVSTLGDSTIRVTSDNIEVFVLGELMLQSLIALNVTLHMFYDIHLAMFAPAGLSAKCGYNLICFLL